MCGLAGMLSASFNEDLINTVLDMGMVSQLRGLDSAGIFMMNTTTGKNDTIKTLGLFTNLYTKKSFSDKLNSIRPNLIMIHTRAATLGPVDMSNCQPIERSAVVGCHNGTISGLSEGSVSDSNVLYTKINTSGCDISDLYSKTIGTGAAALVWTDLEDNTLNILRNTKRTLSFAYDKKKSVMFYMSEGSMLDTMLARTTGYYDTSKSVESGKHAVFNLETLEVSVTDVSKPTTNFVDLYKYNATAQRKTTTPKTVASARAVIKADTSQTAAVVVVPKSDAHVYRGPRGALFTRRQATAHLKQGCCSCSGVPDLSSEVKYIGDGYEYVCEDCYEDNTVAEYVGSKQLHTSKLYIN